MFLMKASYEQQLLQKPPPIKKVYIWDVFGTDTYDFNAPATHIIRHLHRCLF